VALSDLEKLPKEPRTMTKLCENSDNRKITEEPETPKCLDLCSYDIHGFEQNQERKEKLANIIMKFGCGSCGPRAFYGTTIEHLREEEELKKFFGTNEAIIYSYGNNTLTSVVPVYAGAGDYILVDEYCNYSIQLGCRLSKKAKTITFKHNDVEDVKSKIAEIKKTLVFPNKINIVTEGIFQHDYSYAPLKELSKLRSANVYLIVDDSLGFGAVGSNLKGSVEQAGLTAEDVDVLCGSLEFVGSTVGGFVVGKFSKLDKQRLFGAGYIFSASAPPFTCTAGTLALQELEEKGTDMGIELRNKRNKLSI